MEKILDNLKNDLKNIKSIHDLNDIKVKYLGKKGLVTSLYSKMKELTDEDKKSYGASLNNLKNEVTKSFKLSDSAAVNLFKELCTAD